MGEQLVIKLFHNYHFWKWWFFFVWKWLLVNFPLFLEMMTFFWAYIFKISTSVNQLSGFWAVGEVILGYQFRKINIQTFDFWKNRPPQSLEILWVKNSLVVFWFCALVGGGGGGGLLPLNLPLNYEIKWIKTVLIGDKYFSYWIRWSILDTGSFIWIDCALDKSYL